MGSPIRRDEPQAGPAPPRTGPEESRAFLTHQFPAPVAGFLEGRAISPHGRAVVGRCFAPDVETLVAWAAAHVEHHVFVGVNPRKREGGTKDDIAAVNFLHADLDAKRFGGSTAAMLQAIEDFPLPPATIVASGTGYHAYYRLEPAPRDRADFARAEDAMRRLGEYWGGLDATHDISRCLRLPGTVNWDHDAPCRLVARTQTRASLDVYLAHLPAPPAPEAVHGPAPWPEERAPEAAHVADLLRHVPPALPYADWLRVLAAVHSLLPGEDGLDLAATWADDARATSGQQTIAGKRRKWESFRRDGSDRATGYGTLRWYALQGGYVPPTIDPGDPGFVPDRPFVANRPPGPGPYSAPPPPPSGPPPPEDPPPQRDEPPPVSPRRLTPLLAAFAEHLGPASAAWPQDWAIFLALAALSPLFGRITLDGLAPNLWFLGLGPPGAGKSASIDVARQVVGKTAKEAGLAGWSFLSSCTPEGLQATVAGEGRTCVLVQGEFGGTMASMTKEYMLNLRETLCDLYDGRAANYARSKGALVTEGAVVAALAATTYGGFKEHARPQDLANGYLSRFLFCVPDADNVAITLWRSALEHHQLALRLADHLRLLGPVTVARYKSPKVAEARDAFARSLGLGDGRRLRYEDDGEDTLPAGRVVARAIKVAIIAAATRAVPQVSGATLLVEEGDFEFGARVARRGAFYANRAARGVGTLDDDRAYRRIAAVLRQAGDQTPAGLLAPAKVGARTLKDVLHLMVRSGEVAQYTDPVGAERYHWTGGQP